MDPPAGDPEPKMDGSGPRVSEDELARQMIARIARQVDLETGRVPLQTEPEATAERQTESLVDEPPRDAADEPAERSDEEVSRDLVERIAREVDEESHG